jgi:GTP cyclohydrolase I
MEEQFRKIIQAIGEDVEREGLVKTPHRAAQAFTYLTAGYTQSVDEVVNEALFATDSDEMIVVKNVEMYSLCEHHLLPFFGKCHIAYLPQGKIIGLSKLARIVEIFARRLQVQENLTKEIARTIQQITGARGVGVIIEAQHLCMMMRGVEKQSSVMCTSVMLGTLREDARTRSEFLSLIK